jgi:glucose 1-dehydrogenase
MRAQVRVNGIVLGLIKGGNQRAACVTPEQEAEIMELIPYGRYGNVCDVANAALWLASDYLTGALLPVNGGMTLFGGISNGNSTNY